MTEQLFEHALNFGVAGLMGVLWTWERMFSRQRERQLTEAHERMMFERAEVSVLTDLLERNTRAVIRFDETQRGLRRLIEQMLTAQGHRPVDTPRPTTQSDPAGDILHRAESEP